jgi:uncharacterized protein (DUF952 family)
VSAHIHHVAIEDDWEMSRGFGEYEVATRGTHLDDEGFIHATTADRIADVISSRYADISLPLLDITLDADALGSHGIEVEWHDGRPRIMGAVPMTPDVVMSETPIVAR